MPEFTLLSAPDQAANHIRAKMISGVWCDELPGAPALAAELGIDHKTVIAALLQLERQGLLVAQGAGRRRRITLPKNISPPGLRLALLVYEPRDRTEGYMNQLYLLLSEAGHKPFLSPKCLNDLEMDVKRIARMVKRTPADAWVVGAGSQEVLAWFAEQEVPTLALFGRHRDLPLAAAGPDKIPALATATRRLIDLGHRRIAFLCARPHRLPQPGKYSLAVLSELEAAGIKTGEYNLPDWEPTRDGFTAKLDSMFRVTPPTALILDESHLYSAALHFLAERGLRVPHDVSLICTDYDRSFIWSNPTVAHIQWDYLPAIRRIVRWTNNVSRGKDDRRKALTKAEFIDGGTVGPATQ